MRSALWSAHFARLGGLGWPDRAAALVCRQSARLSSRLAERRWPTGPSSSPSSSPSASSHSSGRMNDDGLTCGRAPLCAAACSPQLAAGRLEACARCQRRRRPSSIKGRARPSRRRPAQLRFVPNPAPGLQSMQTIRFLPARSPGPRMPANVARIRQDAAPARSVQPAGRPPGARFCVGATASGRLCAETPPPQVWPLQALTWPPLVGSAPEAIRQPGARFYCCRAGRVFYCTRRAAYRNPAGAL